MENVFQDFFVFSFVGPSRPDRASSYGQKRSLWSTLRKHAWFQKGEIYNSLEKGVIYPVVHRLHLNTDRVALMEPSELGDHYHLRQGVYTELQSFRPPNLVSTGGGEDDDKVHVLVGFVSLEDVFDRVLEDTWKEWTGARLMYSNLSADFGVSRISFYRRLKPADPRLFMYVLLVECCRVDSTNVFRLVNFVQKLRVERVFGYLSAYRTESTLLTSSLINGMLTDAEEANGKVDI